MPALSILDLAFVPEGATPQDALSNTRDLAQHAERWSYHRYWWLSTTIWSGSPAPRPPWSSVTWRQTPHTIRVGAGGIMLPNHSPLVIAEQFGTLEALYPGRIDLGLGRAPGTDRRTVLALRRDPASADIFPMTLWKCRSISSHLRKASGCRRFRARAERANLDPWVEFVWRAARRIPRSAFRLRFAFCSRSIILCAANLPGRFQAIQATRSALCGGRCERLRCRQR